MQFALRECNMTGSGSAKFYTKTIRGVIEDHTSELRDFFEHAKAHGLTQTENLDELARKMGMSGYMVKLTKAFTVNGIPVQGATHASVTPDTQIAEGVDLQHGKRVVCQVKGTGAYGTPLKATAILPAPRPGEG